jgi:hypothetical protein
MVEKLDLAEVMRYPVSSITAGIALCIAEGIGRT